MQKAITMIKNMLLLVLGFGSVACLAQPSEFSYNGSESAKLFAARIQFEGSPAQIGDYVAAFDPDYNCAGTGLVSSNGVFALTTFNVFSKDAFGDGEIDCTPGCEPFTLIYWRMSDGMFYQVPNASSPIMIAYVDANNDGYIDGYSTNDAIFSGVTLNFNGPPTTVLPIELLYFQGKEKELKTQLSWATAAELNNSHFDVEHSTDGRTFKAIGQVKGAGTYTGLTTYEYTDESPATSASTTTASNKSISTVNSNIPR
ncbi:MAG: hypothetical protein KDD12_21800 [Lewinella sp.]|nr:hypothetical protein [Lewinella sp.]